MKEKNIIDERLVGYGINIFLFFSGIFTLIKFNGLGDWIGLLLLTLGFFTLSIQLYNDKMTKYCFTPLGFGFLVPAIFISNENNVIFQIIFILLISLAVTFFSIGMIYYVKNKEKVVYKEINTSVFNNIKGLLLKSLDLIGLIFSIIEILQKIMGN